MLRSDNGAILGALTVNYTSQVIQQGEPKRPNGTSGSYRQLPSRSWFVEEGLEHTSSSSWAERWNGLSLPGIALISGSSLECSLGNEKTREESVDATNESSQVERGHRLEDALSIGRPAKGNVVSLTDYMTRTERTPGQAMPSFDDIIDVEFAPLDQDGIPGVDEVAMTTRILAFRPKAQTHIGRVTGTRSDEIGKRQTVDSEMTGLETSAELSSSPTSELERVESANGSNVVQLNTLASVRKPVKLGRSDRDSMASNTIPKRETSPNILQFPKSAGAGNVSEGGAKNMGRTGPMDPARRYSSTTRSATTIYGGRAGLRVRYRINGMLRY
jgi:hypothetical protein